jgi:hypothetical protein
VTLYVLSGVMELAIWQHNANKEAGNFGDPDCFRQQLCKARLAMFAALGLFAAAKMASNNLVF